MRDKNIDYESIEMCFWCRVTSNKCMVFVWDVWCVLKHLSFDRNFRHLHQMNPQNIIACQCKKAFNWQCIIRATFHAHRTTIYWVSPFRWQWTEVLHLIFRINWTKGLRKTINFPQFWFSIKLFYEQSI